MKLFSSIFIIYILYLVSVPCADKELMCHHLHEQSAPAGNQEIPEQGDACSPFCSCACCSTQTILNTFVTYSQPPAAYRILDMIYNPGSEKIFPPCIWQPPKIG